MQDELNKFNLTVIYTVTYTVLSLAVLLIFLTNFYFAIAISITVLLWTAYYLIFQTTPSKENQTMQGETFNQASNSYAICIANSGYTLRPRDLTTPVKGYVVGLSTSQPELIKDTDFTLEKYVKSFNDVARSILNDNQGTLIAEYVNDDQELVKVSTDLCVGCWLHEGYWYVESTQVIADIRDAMYLAKSNNQKAIWDLANKKEIFIDQVIG